MTERHISLFAAPGIMCQRHQFFVIARINGGYHTLAVVHHQWLYGHMAVRQCLNTMRILGATGNRQGIRRELKLAESKPDSFWDADTRDAGDMQDGVSMFKPARSPSSRGTCTPCDSILARTQFVTDTGSSHCLSRVLSQATGSTLTSKLSSL